MASVILQRPSGLFGREEELAIFDRALKRAATGRLEVVRVEGEPGIGKSRLVSEAVEHGQQLGFSTWTVRFEEMERVRSFGPLMDALDCKVSSVDPRRAEIATAWMSGRIPDADSGHHFRITEALIGLVEEEALAQPRILVLEDLHWADPSSLYAIRTAIKRLAYLPIALVATMRPLPRAQDLQHLLQVLDTGGWVPIKLAGLDSAAVIALVEHLLGSEPSPRIAKRLSSASGNPLFVIELLDALMTEGDVDPYLGEGSLPPDLRLTILRKISFLSDDSIELLRLAAILGSSFSATDLSIVARRPLVELMPLIGQCLTAGIIQEDDEKIRFRHDLIRESLYFDLPGSVRNGLHLEAARRLLESGASPIHVAEHFFQGAEPGDAEAIVALRRAAHEVSNAPETRVVLLQRARELHLDRDRELVQTEAGLADALVWGGRLDEAIPLAVSLLARTQDELLKRRLRRLVARALRIAGKWADLVEVTDNWIDGGLEAEERGLLLAIRAPGATSSKLINHDLVAHELEEALEIGNRTNNDEIRVAALTELVNIRHRQGRVPEEIPIAVLALEIVENNQSSELRSYHPHLWLGVAYDSNSMFEEAERSLLEGLRRRELIGTVWDLAAYQAALAEVYLRSGRWDDAVVAAGSCLDAAYDFSNTAEVAHVVLAEIAAYRGKTEEAKHHLNALNESTTLTPNPLGAEAAVGVQVAIVMNDVTTALPRIRAGMDSRENPNLFLDPDVLTEATAFMVQAGQRGLAQSVVERFEDYVADRIDPQIAATVHAARTVLVDEPTGYESALEQLREVKLWSVALMAEQAGACFARHSLPKEAKRYFEDALASFEGLDAQLLIARVKKTMRSFGIQTGARGKRQRPKFGWEALTDAEQRVVQLASTGFTNRQIAEKLYVSRYTVQTHLKNVFRKLGIVSRMELAAQASKHSNATSVNEETR